MEGVGEAHPDRGEPRLGEAARKLARPEDADVAAERLEVVVAGSQCSLVAVGIVTAIIPPGLVTRASSRAAAR
jgi:hypothetical protein